MTSAMDKNDPSAQLRIHDCAAFYGIPEQSTQSVVAAPPKQVAPTTLPPSADKRTPFEKYQGAYTAAWLLCALSKKAAELVEESHARGIPVDPGS